MFGRFIPAIVNLYRRLVNAWRDLRRRRVDYVRVVLAGSLPEFADPPPRWQRMFLGMRTPASVAAIRRLFALIASDRQCRGVVLTIDGLSGGWATLQSLRAEIAALRAAGKQVIAYLVTPDPASTYVAVAAERIYTPPTAYWSVLGLRSEVQFLREALARWGVEIEAVAVSPYKSGPDTLARTDFSPESREQFERIIDARYAELVRALAEGRALDAGTVRALIDQAPLSPRAARDHGLVDDLIYEDQLEERLGSDTPGPVLLEPEAAIKAMRLPMLSYRKQLIGLIRIEGTIARGASRTLPVPVPLIGATTAGSDSISQALRRAERNPRIAAVVLYVNSPGGEVFASDTLWREVLRLRRQKPVVVAMGNAAASGGYYVATHASAIVAQPATLTGSIGVFVIRPIIQGLLERAGVHTTVVSRGAHSGLLGSTLAPSESERAALRSLVFDLYDDFLTRVSEGRSLDAAQIEPLAGGRVWLGDEALERGLVDRLGGIPEAVLQAQELAKLPLDRHAPLVPIGGGRAGLPPQPFPADNPAAAVEQIAHMLRSNAWALLPFELL